MNRKITKELKTIRDSLENLEVILFHIPGCHTEEPLPETTAAIEHEKAVEAEINVTYPPVVETTLESDIAEIREKGVQKDVPIIGQISSTFDLKSYIKKDKSGTGLIYRVVLADGSGDITVVAFDDMATELKKHPIGTHLRITNAWKVKENKHGIPELHIGNFAKIEVVE